MYEPLLSPLRIGAKTAPSRIVFGAHQTNFATHNRFEARHAAYYAARAAGGAGLIVLESSLVHPSDWPYEYALFGFDERVVEGYKLAAQAIQTHGALALAQLNHSGMQGSSHYSQQALWAPSPVPEVNSRELPKEMEPEDIAAVVDGFAQAARYALAGGLDGVEINAGQESLIRQFLSPLTNQRGDAYGGSLENRLRFGFEVLRAVRRAVGERVIVGLRLSADEHAPWAGLKPEDAVEIAQRLGADRLIDFISVTCGSIYTSHLTRAGLFAAPGHTVHLAAAIKAAVALPVFAQGSIVDPAMAAGILVEGQADAVEMTRALIADPELPRKLRTGQAAAIRPCILCNQDCVVRQVQNPRLSCVHNPAAGYESRPEFAPLTTTSRPRRVLVIGGGPAGLEAARVAALRGHQVTLYEQRDRLGGAMRLAAAAPGRERLALAVEWLTAQVRALGVTIWLGVAATPETIRDEQPDAVIVAVGGKPGRLPAIDLDRVRLATAHDVLSGTVAATPGKAVLLDSIGDQVGMGVAEWLAGRGWQVEIVTEDLFAGQRLTATQELTAWNQRAAAKTIGLRPMIEVQRVSGRTLIGVDRFSRQELRIEEIDLLVTIGHDEPDEQLYFALQQQFPALRLERAGDCVAPRKLSQAILEGYRAGLAV